MRVGRLITNTPLTLHQRRLFWNARLHRHVFRVVTRDSNIVRVQPQWYPVLTHGLNGFHPQAVYSQEQSSSKLLIHPHNLQYFTIVTDVWSYRNPGAAALPGWIQPGDWLYAAPNPFGKGFWEFVGGSLLFRPQSSQGTVPIIF